MNEDNRDASIDAYFRALDADDFSIVEPYVAEDLAYKSVGVEELRGHEGLQRYFDELRSFDGTDHVVETTVHGDDRSAAEGHVTGTYDGETIDTGFCDVFEFDDAEERITRITVYTNA